MSEEIDLLGVAVEGGRVPSGPGEEVATEGDRRGEVCVGIRRERGRGNDHKVGGQSESEGEKREESDGKRRGRRGDDDDDGSRRVRGQRGKSRMVNRESLSVMVRDVLAASEEVSVSEGVGEERKQTGRDAPGHRLLSPPRSQNHDSTMTPLLEEREPDENCRPAPAAGDDGQDKVAG